MSQASLPRQPFFDLAAETPLALLKGRIYLLSGVEPARDYLWFEDQRYALAPGPRLSELEEAYAQIFSAELRSYKLNSLQQAIKQGALEVAEVQQAIADDRILSFIVLQMIPKLQHMRAWWGLPPQQAKQPALGTLDGQPECRGVLSERHARRLGSGLLASALGDDALIVDEKVYQLTILNDEEGQGDFVVNFAGRLYCPSYPSCRYLYEIEANFSQVLDQELRRRALAELTAYRVQLQHLQQRRRDLLASCGYEQVGEDGLTYLYRDEHAGIVKLGADWWVYVEVPEFVLQDYNEPGAYYSFGRTRVGVRLYFDWSTGQLDFQIPAQVLTPGYEHPYTGNGSDQSICLGNYQWSWREGHALEDVIYKYLLDGRTTLMRGYHPYNRNTPRLRLETLPHRRISGEQVQQLGLCVTNRP